MSRAAASIGLLGLAILAGAVAYATSGVELAGSRPVLNVAPPTERVRVEVLNAGGVSGQARAATLQLREIGFDVVHFGNADRFDREASSVVDRVGRPELARAVADALGIEEVVREPDPNLFVDVTVLLGTDWRARAGTEAADEAPPEREPWDPRGWVGR